MNLERLVVADVPRRDWYYATRKNWAEKFNSAAIHAVKGSYT